MSSIRTKSALLAVGGISAILASVCCLGPFLLVSLGLGGAWAANLKVFEAFRPYLLGVALVSIFFAWRRIYRPKVECVAGEVCSLPKTNKIYRGVFWLVAVLVLVALTFPYVAMLFS